MTTNPDRDRMREIAAEMVRSWGEDAWPEDPVKEITESLIKAHNEALERAAELCRRKYPCGDPGHDDRWCARCNAIQDGADMLEDEILALKSPAGDKDK